ncbi:Deoxycytidylate deaminase [Astathelohania contejeani]|uniref:dCMP deaminase n=1 Tax=Astathelohania contejeani TaxID=164912 RepID=A0ABQ7I1A9_9MICR|nr:Deoxycytidylate deaminase [Thelohania contejeani]
MIICIYGAPKSGKKTMTKMLQSQNFKFYEYTSTLASDIITNKLWNDQIVTIIPSLEVWKTFYKRPFCVLFIIYAPTRCEWRVHNDDQFYKDTLAFKEKYKFTQIVEIANFDSFAELQKKAIINITDMRPEWDKYFLKIANCVSMRSNCMKRRVGAVIVKENRIISTGYNGTPNYMTNCYENGCLRCNDGEGNNIGHDYCLCLHAEENALLVLGRNDSVDSALYTTLFPCKLCTKKIIQMGIKRVFYHESYSLVDQEVKDLFEKAGIVIKHIEI